MKSDLRIIRTKDNIKKAFISLLQEKDFNLITVKDITERGMMNRGTFYAHYSDKYDLMYQLKQELIKGMSEIIECNFHNVVEDDNYYQLSAKMINFIKIEHQLFNILLVKQGDYNFQKEMKNIIIKVLINNVENISNIRKFDYTAAYIASANIGVLQEWLENGLKETPDEIAKLINYMTLNGPIETIRNKNYFY